VLLKGAFMGRQYNKVEKRRRRKAYVSRLKEQKKSGKKNN